MANLSFPVPRKENLAAAVVFSFLIYFTISQLPLNYINTKTGDVIYTQPKTFPFTLFRLPTKNMKQYWEDLRPGFSCPPHLLKETGHLMKNAQKWTCGLSNLGRYKTCVVYSFGVGRNSFFEEEVLSNTHCEVYAFDPTVDGIAKPIESENPRAHFFKLGLAGRDSELYKTLKTLMKLNGGHDWIDILKIDVEGAEFESLEKIMQDFPPPDNSSSSSETGYGLPFGQLLLEVHAWGTAKTEEVKNLLEKLERRNLRLFYTEYNNVSTPRGCCSEVSFINVDQFALNRFLGSNENV